MNEQQTAAADGRTTGLTQVSASEWADVAKQTWTEAGEDNLPLIASGIAFNIFLAVVPMLTAAVIGYGLIASPEEVARHIQALARALPREAAQIIGDQLQSMTGGADTAKGLGLLLALVIALYGALRAATGVIVGLNITLDVKESRSLVRQTGVALAITLGMILLFFVASAAISLGSLIAGLLPQWGGAAHAMLQVGTWIAAAALVGLVIAAIYAFAPNRDEPEWRWLTPGSIFATIAWILATLAFSFYVSNFGNYNATYGALGAVIIFLTWLYLSAYILLLGAELNQVIAKGPAVEGRTTADKNGRKAVERSPRLAVTPTSRQRE